MVVSCVAYGCTNRHKGAGSSLAFHKFPQDIEKRRKWIHALRRDNFEPTSSSRLCSEHFQPSDYENYGMRRRLKIDAVPSIFLAFPEHLQTIKVKKRRILPDWHGPDPSSAASSTDRLATAYQPAVEPQTTGLCVEPRAFPVQDHEYAFPSSLELAKKKCDKLQVIKIN